MPGVYIHIPFCKTRCTYCNFSFVVNYPEALPARYARAVAEEIRQFSGPPAIEIDSIYFGGGTPSNVPVAQTEGLLAACRRRFRWSEESEIAIEINPDTLTEEKARLYRAAGINRASLGAQSFTDPELAAVGRSHTGKQIGQAYHGLRRAEFSNINLDLMIGLPGQTWTSWRDTLRRTEDLHPEHISIYMLELEPETRLGRDAAQGRVILPDDAFITEAYLETIDRLAVTGYRHYEISNFAQPGKASRHNLKYWADAPYYGFGASSHAYFGSVRYRNEPDPERYIRQIEETGSGMVEQIPISPERHFREAFYLRLRRIEGVDLDAFTHAFGPDIRETHGTAIERLIEAGLLVLVDGHLRLTRSGLVLSNEVFQEFL